MILTDDGHVERSAWNGFCQKQQIHNDREYNRYSKRDFLSGVGWEKEADHCEHGQQSTRDDYIQHVERVSST